MASDESRAEDGQGGTQELPWCPDCEVFAVPTDDGNCGDCGTSITYREGDR